MKLLSVAPPAPSEDKLAGNGGGLLGTTGGGALAFAGIGGGGGLSFSPSSSSASTCWTGLPPSSSCWSSCSFASSRTRAPTSARIRCARLIIAEPHAADRAGAAGLDGRAAGPLVRIVGGALAFFAVDQPGPGPAFAAASAAAAAKEAASSRLAQSAFSSLAPDVSRPFLQSSYRRLKVWRSAFDLKLCLPACHLSCSGETSFHSASCCFIEASMVRTSLLSGTGAVSRTRLMSSCKRSVALAAAAARASPATADWLCSLLSWSCRNVSAKGFSRFDNEGFSTRDPIARRSWACCSRSSSFLSAMATSSGRGALAMAAWSARSSNFWILARP
mmetsp:Transcript_53003/g.139004  ORF Transcript_53003/g.139004 Transcript_53003/m.139004 type:complete len:332 (+) Transcript_53003:824-1819(+)